MHKLLYILFLLMLLLSSCRDADNKVGKQENLKPDSLAIGLIDSLNQLARSHFSDPSFALKDSIYALAHRSIALARQTGYERGEAMGLYHLGRYYITLGTDPAQATHHLLGSLEIYSRLGDKENMSRCYMQLGLIHYMIEFYEEGIRNLLLAVETNDLPIAKYLLALSYTKIGDFPNALKYFNRSIAYYSSVGDNKYLTQCYLHLGQLYLEMGRVDSSFIALEKSRQYKEAGSDETDLIRWYAFLSRAFLESGQVDSALYYGEKSYALETGKEAVLKDEIALIEATQTLSRAYSQRRQFKKAFYFLEQYHTAKTYLTEGNSNQKVTHMLNMFEFEQKMDQQRLQREREQELSRQQIASARQLRNFLIAGALFLIILLVLLYHRYKFKRNSNRILEEKNNIISREKERSEELLLNILPDEVAEELKNKGAFESRIIEEVTVIFTDFQGFTSLTKQMTPTELVNDLHECFSAFDRICEKYHIEKIKTIGDAYMAVGGIPVENASHAVTSVKAALEMVEFIQTFKERKIRENRPYFEIRVGLHSGQVVAGIVGLKKFQYDIWGDTVNIANRMESHGLVGRVNISHRTYDLVRYDPELSFESRGKIQVKGSLEIEAWLVSKKQDNQSA